VMADLQTIAERCPLEHAVIAYVGDGNNVVNSLLHGAALFGLELRVATPATHRPDERVWKRSEELAAKSGAALSWTEDPREAVSGAGFVYTDVWTSMGQESERELRRRIFAAYQVNEDLLALAPGAWVMHCLPAHRGEEITDRVLDGPRAIAFDQAENRLHSQKAILERLLAHRD